MSYCYAIILFFNNTIQLNDRLQGQLEIIKHMNMLRPSLMNALETLGNVLWREMCCLMKCAVERNVLPHCGSNWQDQISDINCKNKQIKIYIHDYNFVK